MRFNIQSKLFFGYLLILLFGFIIISVATAFIVIQALMVFEPLFKDNIVYSEDEGKIEIQIEENRFERLEEYANPEIMLVSLGQTLGGVAVSVLLITMLLSWIYSRMFVNPIRKIVAATRSLAGGDYTQRVRIRTRDEIQDLGNALNSLAENLQRTETLRRDLVSNVSHELATPLTSVKGYIEAIREGVITDEEQIKKTMGIIYEETERLNAIVNDLRELSKIESAGFSLVKEPVDLSEVVDHTVTSMMPLAEEGGVTLKSSVSSRLPKVMADRGRLAQVFVNLIDNAMRFTPSGGTVEVSAARRKGFVAIDVSDSGKGIPVKDLPHIFERFYRADKSRSRQTGGTGIGLSIVHQLVTAHGGDITVKSELGKGTTFTFTVPVTD